MAELRRKHPERGVMRGERHDGCARPKQDTVLRHLDGDPGEHYIPSVADRRVVDKTGLTGYYDLAVPSSALRRPPPPPPPGASQPLDAPSPPLEEESIFAALEALGLRLEPAKGQVETLMIDHVERPSEN